MALAAGDLVQQVDGVVLCLTVFPERSSSFQCMDLVEDVRSVAKWVPVLLIGVSGHCVGITGA